MSQREGIWSKRFWKDTAERAVSTTAQAAVAVVAVDVASPIWDLDWVHITGISATAGVLSVLKAIGAGAATGTPSVGGVEIGPAKNNRLAKTGTEQGM